MTRLKSFFAPPDVPLRSSPQGGSLCCRSGSGRRKGMVLRHSRGFYGPEITWPVDRGSGSRWCSRSRPPVASGKETHQQRVTHQAVGGAIEKVEKIRGVLHLIHGDVVLPVDLVGRRVEPLALLHVLVENAAALHVTQAKLTQVELW